jgi:hypothetical protein
MFWSFELVLHSSCRAQSSQVKFLGNLNSLASNGVCTRPHGKEPSSSALPSIGYRVTNSFSFGPMPRRMLQLPSGAGLITFHPTRLREPGLVAKWTTPTELAPPHGASRLSMISLPTGLRSIGVTRRNDYKDYSPISYWSVAFISEGKGGAARY